MMAPLPIQHTHNKREANSFPADPEAGSLPEVWKSDKHLSDAGLAALPESLPLP